MANRLKIYACSGIGSEIKLPKVTFDNYGTKTTDNTQAVNTILIRMNGCRVRLEKRQLDGYEREQLQGQLNVYKDCLDAARSYAGNNTALMAAGEQIQSKWGLGADFMMWWRDTIVPRNKFGLDQQKRTAAKKAIKRISTINGIGELDWRDNEELTEYLTKGSEYFLYLFFTDEQIKQLPIKNQSAIRKKIVLQRKTYNYCKALFIDIYGSEQDMVDVIRDGIIEYFEGATPEEVCADIVAGKREMGVGYLFGAETAAAGIKMLIELLGILLALVASVIAAICDCVARSNVARYAAINRETVEESVPNPKDWEGLSIGGSKAGMSWLPLVAVGAGLLIFGKNF